MKLQGLIQQIFLRSWLIPHRSKLVCLSMSVTYTQGYDLSARLEPTLDGLHSEGRFLAVPEILDYSRMGRQWETHLLIMTRNWLVITVVKTFIVQSQGQTL
jgi:hypothetical protein